MLMLSLNHIVLLWSFYACGLMYNVMFIIELFPVEPSGVQCFEESKSFEGC